MSENSEPVGGQDDPYELFGQWLEGPPKQKQEEVAALLHVSQQYVSAIKRKLAVPGPMLRVRLQLVAGIERNLWPETDHISDAEADLIGQTLDEAPTGTDGE